MPIFQSRFVSLDLGIFTLCTSILKFYSCVFNRFSHNTLVGMMGVVDYTNYDDMKYAVS